MYYNFLFCRKPDFPSEFYNCMRNKINKKISSIKLNCDKYNYLKKKIINIYIKKIKDNQEKDNQEKDNQEKDNQEKDNQEKDKKEKEKKIELILLCNIICEKYLYEIYMSNELYNIILDIRYFNSGSYLFSSLFLNINKEMEKIKKNMFIKRQYARVINGYCNYENDLTHFFKKYCGLRKFIGNKLMSF